MISLELVMSCMSFVLLRNFSFRIMFGRFVIWVCRFLVSLVFDVLLLMIMLILGFFIMVLV